MQVTDGALARTTETWEEARGFVSKELREHPFRTLLLAVGAGYVVGGGLFSVLTGKIVGTSARVALRAVTLPMMLQGGMDIAERLFSSASTTSVEK